jgi:hypothetical protein
MVGNEGKWNDVTCNDTSNPIAVLCEKIIPKARPNIVSNGKKANFCLLIFYDSF